MMKQNIIPVVPSQGSVGSSGDLVQLAHLVLAMIGRGRVQIIKNILDEDAASSEIINSTEGLKKSGLKPIVLEAKEGLALINGTQMMTSFASFIAVRAKKLNKIAELECITHSRSSPLYR